MTPTGERPDQGIDWDYIEAHHRPVMLISRPAYERWILILFGVVLVCLLMLTGWAMYSLSTVKTELSQLKLSVAQEESLRPGDEVVSQVVPSPVEDRVQPLPASEELGSTARATEAEQPVQTRAYRPPQPSMAPSPSTAGADTAPRIYLHIRSPAQLKVAQHITAQMKKKGYVFPKAEILVEKGPQQTQVRYFRRTEASEAASITALLTQVHRQQATTSYIRGYEDSPLIRSRHYEIWLSPDAL
jgi:hypothetical protein